MKHLILLSSLINRSEMNCTVQDLIRGLIPSEYLKRSFLNNFIFVHKNTNEILFPTKLDKYKKIKKTDITSKDDFTFYEINDTIKDNSITVKMAEHFTKSNIRLKTFNALEFNTSHGYGHILHPLFSTISNDKKPMVYDDFNNILVYFITNKDYSKYKKFLNKEVGKFL